MINFKHVEYSTIRHRIISSVSLLIVLTLLSIAAITYFYFENHTKKMILENETTLLLAISHQLDKRISLAEALLSENAKKVDANVLSSSQNAQVWLNNNSMETMFNHSTIILDKSGVLLAANPPVPDIYGSSFAFREYYIKAMETKSIYISKPFITAANDHPVIMIASPVFSKDGSILGLLCSAIDLIKEDGLLNSLNIVKIGKSGYLYLFDEDRTMIMHPDSTRIMRQDVEPGMNQLFDKAIEGFEGSGETVNSKGIPMLTAYHHLHETKWIIAATVPISEAYQPIYQFRQYFFVGIFIVTLISVFYTWFLSYRIVLPINRFCTAIEDMTHKSSSQRTPITIDDFSELKQLSNAFNTLIQEISLNEQTLQTSNIHLEESVTHTQSLLQIAQEANKMKSQFLSIMSHELRTPMNGILGFLELLKRSSLNEEQSDFVEEARASSKVLLNLINDILDLSNIEAGNLKIENTYCNLFQLIEETIAEHQKSALEKGLTLTTQLQKELPEYLSFDALHFKQVLNNLLSNAIKFSHSGTICFKVSAAIVDQNQLMLKCSLSDEGIGINPKQLDSIFNPFTQLDASSTRKYGGTGLGLAISKELVTAMGGNITVTSTANVGSTFTFTVLGNILDQRVSSSLSSKNILLIDDNAIQQKVLSKMFNSMNISCAVAPTQLEGYELIDKNDYDFIFISMHNLFIDIDEFIANIRLLAGYKENTKIFGMTSNADELYLCQVSSLQGCIEKPIHVDQLIDLLNQ